MARLPEPLPAGGAPAPGRLSAPLTLGLVGSGRAASTLARSLRRGGHRVMVARRGGSARALAAGVRGRLAGAEEVLAQADVTLLAVPDGAIAGVAASLARDTARGDGRLVAHLSGSQGREILEPLAAKGFATAAIHPLQVLSGWRIPPGTAFAVEAAAGERSLASRLVAELGGVEIELPAGARAAYHAAAVMSANLGMTLLAEAVDLLQRQGVPRADALSGLASLVRGGLEASVDRGLPEALTGPVTRGDVSTVARHLEALSEDPDLRRAYAAASILTLRQAARDGRPGDPAAAEIRQLLEAVL